MIYLKLLVVCLLVSVESFIRPSFQLSKSLKLSSQRLNRSGDSRPTSANNGVNEAPRLTSTTKINGKPKIKGGLPTDGVRVNKCLNSLSRRGADDAIAEGRVTINNKPAKAGDRVIKGDVVKLDNVKQHWEGVQRAKSKSPSMTNLESRDFIYLKYWKPKGKHSNKLL